MKRVRDPEVAGRRLDEYKPIKNQFNCYAGFDGCMFETYGEELAFVAAANPNCIWTVMDVEGELWVCAGAHTVNRVGYLVTTIPWEMDTIAFDEDDRRVDGADKFDGWDK